MGSVHDPQAMAIDGPLDGSFDSTERELIEEAQRDPRRFAALYRSHYDAIGGYLFRRTGDPHVTEDLLSEVFLKALQSLPRYRCRGVPFRHWLLRIATNLANRHARRAGRSSTMEEGVERQLPGSEPGVSEQAVAREFTERARHVMRTLSPKLQSVLALHCLEGLEIRDVAVVIGRSEGTVKSRLHRARAAMRQALETRRPITSKQAIKTKQRPKARR